MCGILGTTNVRQEYFDSVLDGIAHRGPDGRGQFHTPQAFLGHRRLAIIDVLERASQPMHTEDGKVSLVFNGEIYNYKELKRDLVNQGAVFNTESDTEVILQGYAIHGIQFFERLRGMWAICILDHGASEMHLSRDQFGIKPLYYAWYKDNLYFSSEMRSFYQWPIELTPNTEAYATFFNLGYFIAPETSYREVKTLLPGEVLTYSFKGKKFKRSKVIFSGSEPAYAKTGSVIDGLHQALKSSVDAHFVSDVPVGLLFSGGNDSSLIAALAKAVGQDPIAFHLAIAGGGDTSYAYDIAKYLGLRFENIEMTESELVEQYSWLWEHLDVPFADISIIPTSLIYKKIEGRSKVVLSGEGGDEYFGGYLRHRRLVGMRKSGKSLQGIVNNFYGSKSWQVRHWNPVFSRIARLAADLSKDVVDTYLQETRIIDYPISYQDMHEYLSSVARNSVYPVSLSLDRDLYLMNDLLFKNDFSSMAASVEARVPLVDSVLTNFIDSSVPREQQHSIQHPNKSLLKEILSMYLPNDLVHRPKRGFGFSFSRYHIPALQSDLGAAIKFHVTHADLFGLTGSKKMLSNLVPDAIIKKYPRFAFALISNHKVVSTHLGFK